MEDAKSLKEEFPYYRYGGMVSAVPMVDRDGYRSRNIGATES